MTTATATAPRLRIYALMDEDQIVRAVHDLERQLDRLDNACYPSANYPSANIERAQVLDALDAARCEIERRAA